MNWSTTYCQPFATAYSSPFQVLSYLEVGPLRNKDQQDALSSLNLFQ